MPSPGAAEAAPASPTATTPARAQPVPPDTRRSGRADMSPATQAMQHDDAANPAWLWVEDGRQRFAAQCTRCHAVGAMAGVAARYPAWDAASRRPLTLGQRIADCHVRRNGGPPLPPEDEGRLALEIFVALQSRGQPIAPPADARLVPWRDRGGALFRRRQGQLDLSCAQCHEQFAGRRLAGSVIPQGHATGYPIYRLEWQGVGSLQRRLRGCLVGVRAEPLPADGDEATALEIYLMSRAAGMPLETPAVRP
ncbi:MAG: sulfur oxidation c-type cytochrome SoxA [Rubrivivax sp.]|nr:sulfur oxidation c-type cytochrome SoxA [Rubrivivax sp.]